MLDALTGQERWRFQYPARSRDTLDYGNAPRATPLIDGQRAFLLGAFGHLHCVDLATGDVLWASQIAEEFETKHPSWGYAGSPLLADGRLILQPGGKDAALIALDPATGDLLWQTPGRKPGYAALIRASIHGKSQLIGLDDETIGGWDAATGQRLWEIKPAARGDFHVPTPFMVGEKLFVTSENNGSRLFAFDAQGLAQPTPIATNEDLAPDAHTPVRVGDCTVGCHNGLHCLRASDLKSVWHSDLKLGDYASMITDGRTRVLTLGDNGTLALHDIASPKPLATLSLTREPLHILTHPALVNDRLYLRLGQRVACLRLSDQASPR